jgi:hypothetical protein
VYVSNASLPIILNLQGQTTGLTQAHGFHNASFSHTVSIDRGLAHPRGGQA